MKQLALLGCILAILFTDKAISQDEILPLLALTNITVIDGTGAEPVSGMTVLIEGEHIRNLFRTGTQPLPEYAEERNLSGKYLIPGLINSHVHFTPLDHQGGKEHIERELRRMLYGGVTAVHDLAGDVRLRGYIQREITLGRMIGPDYYYATILSGPDFTANDPRVERAATGIRPFVGEVTAETDVRSVISALAGTGATTVKLYMQIDAPLMRALTEEAHRQGLRVWAHTTVFPDRPIDVVRAGVDGVSHLCWLAWESNSLDPFQNVSYVHTGFPPAFDAGLVDINSPEFTTLFNEMREQGTILDATYSLRMGGEYSRWGCTPELVTALARTAHAAGIPFSTGTDNFVDESEPWPSVFREIEHLVDHDILTPLEAITAATLNGAKAIGIEETQGTIEPGKLASIVVLAENPTQDIAALRTVQTVFKRGMEYTRKDFRASNRY